MAEKRKSIFETATEMAIIDFGYQPKHYESDYEDFMKRVKEYEADLLGHRAEKRVQNQFKGGKGKRHRRRKASRFNPDKQFRTEKWK